MPEPDKPASGISVSLFNPFPGLRAFEPDEDYLYFGRERQIDELLRRLGEHRLLAVVGASGSGKSSLVRAGLVPALYSGFMTRAGSSWRVAILRPAGDPIGNLAAVLDDPAVLGQDRELGEAGRMIIESTLRASSLGLADCVRQSSIHAVDNVLVVVDQFEELFRFKRSARSSRDEAVAFVKLLLAAAESDVPIYVVITMRSDFIGDCMEFPGLPEAINRGQYLVPRMTREELRLAITGPVGVRGAQISPRLVSRLLNDVEDDQDQLPVLQHALMRMWTSWEQSESDESILDLNHYEAIGSLGEALSRHAESIYQQLASDPDREIAERLFRALTDTDRDGRGIRRPVQVEEVCAIAGAEQAAVVRVIEQFRFQGRSFLMPPSSVELSADSLIDLSHESLMRNWVRLKGWAVEEAESAAIYRRLSQSASLARAGEGGLWRSPELDIGLRWRETERPTAAWAVRYDPDFEEAMTFLDRSQEARDDYLARREEEERQHEESRRRQLRMSKLLTLSLAIIFALATAMFIYFHIQGRRAEQQARLQAVLSARDPLVRVQLLAELEDTVDLDWGLEVVQQVATADIPRAVLRGRDGELVGIAFGSDDERVATVSAKGAIDWWRGDGRGEPRRSLLVGPPPGEDAPPELTAVAFSADDRTLAAGLGDGTLLVGASDPEPGAGAPRRIAGRGSGARIRSLAFSPDGRRIVAGSDDYGVAIWSEDGDGWSLLGDVGEERHKGPVSGVAFAADGETVASASWDGTARVWDLRGGPPRVLLAREGSGALQSVAFSPDGQWVISASSDGSVLIWSREGGSPLEIAGHGGSAKHAAFGPDGLRVVASFEDRTAEVWSLQKSPEGGFVTVGTPNVLGGHTGPVTAAVFSHSGDEIATISDDGTARIWPREPEEPRILGRHDKGVESVAFSPDAKRVASASRDPSARVWALDGSEVSVGKKGGTGYGDWVRKVAFDPTGTRVLTGSEDGTFRVWDLADDTVHVYPEGAPVLGTAFDPAGKRIVTATKDHVVHVWQIDATDKPTLVADLQGHEHWVWSAAFSGDGTRVVTASRDGTARVWKVPVARGRPVAATAVAVLEGHGDQVRSAAFSPDGARVVTASADGTARIWTLNGSTGTIVLRHEDEVNEASFSTNGAWVVTASKDGTARIWSADLGVERLVLRHGKPVRSAVFSPGSAVDRGEPTYVATGTEDGTVRVWRVSLSALVAYARNATTGCLTADQRLRLLGESGAQARRKFAQCERRYDRKPAE